MTPNIPTPPDGESFGDLTRAINGLAIEQARSTAVTETRMDAIEKSIADLARLFSDVSSLKTLVEVQRSQLEALRDQASENRANIASLSTMLTTHEETRKEYVAWHSAVDSSVKDLNNKDVEQDKKLVVIMFVIAIIGFLAQIVVSVWIGPVLQKVFGT